MTNVKIALSPCPNDLFIFGMWILGLLPQEFTLRPSFVFEDVQTLNEEMKRGTYDLIKVSSAQALRHRDSYAILPSGGAFGKGVGPKVVARSDFTNSINSIRSVVVPGMETTAVLLLKKALGNDLQIFSQRYEEIPQAVQNNQADAGLLIHETALVPEKYGLREVLDLGAWWRQETGLDLIPLGCIAIRNTLDNQDVSRCNLHIQASLRMAWQDRGKTIWPLIQAFAQELDDATIKDHLDAYVSTESLQMSTSGRQALSYLESWVSTLNEESVLHDQP